MYRLPWWTKACCHSPCLTCDILVDPANTEPPGNGECFHQIQTLKTSRNVHTLKIKFDITNFLSCLVSLGWDSLVRFYSRRVVESAAKNIFLNITKYWAVSLLLVWHTNAFFSYNLIFYFFRFGYVKKRIELPHRDRAQQSRSTREMIFSSLKLKMKESALSRW